MDDFKKENPATNGACLTTDISNNTPKPKKGQCKNGFTIEVTIQPDNPENTPFAIVLDGDAARSLLYLYERQRGLSRAEALSKYGVLSLTPHVFRMRHKWGLDIFTERVPPTRYGIYHLITPVSIRILSQGGQ